VSEQLAQGILLSDPIFLREIVERVLQEMLEAEVTEHIGAASYERTDKRTGHRSGYKPRLWGPRPAPSTYSCPRTLRRRLLHAPFLALPKEREGTLFGFDGEVRGGRLHQEGQGGDRIAVRDLLQEPRLFAGRFSELGARCLEGSPTRCESLSLRVRGRPLREGESGWAGGEPGGPHRLGR
jgi:hypothetical protein